MNAKVTDTALNEAVKKECQQGTQMRLADHFSRLTDKSQRLKMLEDKVKEQADFLFDMDASLTILSRRISELESKSVDVDAMNAILNNHANHLDEINGALSDNNGRFDDHVTVINNHKSHLDKINATIQGLITRLRIDGIIKPDSDEMEKQASKEKPAPIDDGLMTVDAYLKERNYEISKGRRISFGRSASERSKCMGFKPVSRQKYPGAPGSAFFYKREILDQVFAESIERWQAPPPDDGLISINAYVGERNIKLTAGQRSSRGRTAAEKMHFHKIPLVQRRGTKHNAMVYFYPREILDQVFADFPKNEATL